MNCYIRPLPGYVVLRRVRPPEQTEGGILLPEGYKRRITLKNRNPKPEPACGVVGAGKWREMKVVYVHRPELWSVVEDGWRWWFVAESDVLARVEWVQD